MVHFDIRGFHIKFIKKENIMEHIILVSIIFISSFAFSTVINIPADYSTIQDFPDARRDEMFCLSFFV